MGKNKSKSLYKSIQSSIKINKSENSVVVIIDPNIYNINIIYTTCYALIDKVYVHITGNPEFELTIELKPKENSDLEKLGKEFENELIKYAFYQKQHNETIGLKVLMLKRILALTDNNVQTYIDENIKEKIEKETELINNNILPKFDDELNDDFFDDPEGIAIPWEEKYGKKQNDKKREKSKNKKTKTKK
jgi:His-Xaa-Ser system protein HxsD